MKQHLLTFMMGFLPLVASACINSPVLEDSSNLSITRQDSLCTNFYSECTADELDSIRMIPYSRRTIEKLDSIFTRQDSLCMILYSVSSVEELGYCEKRTASRVITQFPILKKRESQYIDSIVVNSTEMRTFMPIYERKVNSLKELLYKPNYYLECYAISKDQIQARYNLFIDSRINLCHISTRIGNVRFVSRPSEDIDVINKIVDILQRKIDVDTDNEISEIVESPLESDFSLLESDFFKKKTSDEILKGVVEWQLKKVLLLNPMKESRKMVHGCSIVASSKALQEKDEVAIKHLLLNSENYSHSNSVKNATFLPDFMCQFTKGDEKIDVLVALYCDEIKIFYKKEEFTLDITPAHDKFASFIKNIFPNDKYLLKY